jgi:DNA-binding GntR family transcriptional regulator
MPITQEDTVFLSLKEGIVGGKVPVGEFLSQRKLAQQFDTSLITLRAALRRLENHGLIESIPRWGVRIPQDNPEKVRDRYFMREVLELAAWKRARPSLTQAQAARLSELAVACDEFQGADDTAIRGFADVHMTLHRSLVEYADSRELLAHYERLMARCLMLINARRVWAEIDHGPRYHQALVRTLLESSQDEAVAALRAHIRLGLTGELKQLATGQTRQDEDAL